MTRGVPTSYAANRKRDISKQGEPLPVWPSSNGPIRGTALEPLYPGVPEAVERDSYLYELLALVDAIRDGRTGAQDC